MSIAKGPVFCLPQHLTSYAADVFGRLAAVDRLRGLNREQFITRLAEFLADVNALHPFREGNGRAQRAFFSQLAHDAGHHTGWIRMDPDRNTTASAAAHHGDLTPLIEMLGDLIDPHTRPAQLACTPANAELRVLSACWVPHAVSRVRTGRSCALDRYA